MSQSNPHHDSPRPSGRCLGDWLSATERIAGPEVLVSSCCSSADLVQPGDLYFSLEEDTVAATDNAHQAIERGAAAVVVEQMLPLAGVTQYRVANARRSLAEFCQTLVGRPSRETSLVGVVGTPSTAPITRLAAAALAAAGRDPAWWDGRWVSEPLTPPSDAGPVGTPPLVASWLSKSVAAGCTHAVASVQPPALQSHAVAACDFAVVCLAGSLRNTSAGSSLQESNDRLASLVAQLKPTGVLVANAADPDCCRIAATSPQKLLTFGLNHAADICGEVIEKHSGGQTLLVRWESDSIAIETPVIGVTHAEHCLAAVAIGLACGADLRAIVKGIESAPRPPGVLEPVVLGQDFNVFLDAADHCERLRAAATAAQQATTGRLITVLNGTASSRTLSTAAAKSSLVITAGKPTPGLTGRPEFRFVDEPFAAVALGVALAESGDTVLISGVELDAEGRCTHSEIVRELIALRNQNTPPTNWAA